MTANAEDVRYLLLDQILGDKVGALHSRHTALPQASTASLSQCERPYRHMRDHAAICWTAASPNQRADLSPGKTRKSSPRYTRDEPLERALVIRVPTRQGRTVFDEIVRRPPTR